MCLAGCINRDNSVNYSIFMKVILTFKKQNLSHYFPLHPVIYLQARNVLSESLNSLFSKLYPGNFVKKVYFQGLLRVTPNESRAQQQMMYYIFLLTSLALISNVTVYFNMFQRIKNVKVSLSYIIKVFQFGCFVKINVSNQTSGTSYSVRKLTLIQGYSK